MTQKHSPLSVSLLLASTIAVFAPAQTVGDQQTINKFLTDWFRNHGEKQIITDTQGIGLKGNPARIKSSVYGLSPHPNGIVAAELEFKIKITDRCEIVEYVAGIAKGNEAAIQSALMNFMLSTFHVVYKGYFNNTDPHQELKPTLIQGLSRNFIIGDMFAYGVNQNTKLDFSSISKPILSAIQSTSIGPGPHWIKIVYSQQPNSPSTCTVTVDNYENPQLSSAIGRLPWPKSSSFYMAKQFILIK